MNLVVLGAGFDLYVEKVRKSTKKCRKSAKKLGGKFKFPTFSRFFLNFSAF